MNRVLNATVQRTADHAAPEITLDPLEIVGGMFLSVPPVFQCTTLELAHSFPLPCRPRVSSPDLKTHLCCLDSHLFTRVLFCTSCDLWRTVVLILCLTFRRNQVFGEHVLLPGCASALLRAIVAALCEAGQRRRPHLCLQHPLHRRGSSWHKLEFFLRILYLLLPWWIILPMHRKLLIKVVHAKVSYKC